MMDGSLETFCETWPRAGTMLSGTAYRLPQLVPLTGGIVSSLWPTPRCAEATMKTRAPVPSLLDGTRSHGWDLVEAVWDDAVTHHKTWPTPAARDWRSGKTLQDYGNSRPLSEQVSGQLNPTWVEWLMGFPLGWTDLDVSETP